MTFWIAPVEVVGEDPFSAALDEMTPDWEEVTTSHFRTAVAQAITRFGKSDWTICAHENGSFPTGEDWGPGEELAYHAKDYPNVLFVRTLGLRHLGPGAIGVGHGHRIEELVVERDFADAAAEWAGRDNHYPLRTSNVFRNCRYPGELVNYNNFSDTSYGNDATASIQFSIGAEVFRVWIAPLRPFDRPADVREQGAKAFQVAEFNAGESADQDIDDALENADQWSNDIAFETDSIAALNDYFARIWNAQAAGGRERAAAAGAKAASPERQLGNAAAKLAPYNGWKIEYHPDSEMFEAHHPDSDIHLQWTIDQPERGQIGIAAMEADGVLEDGRIAFATMGRDADKLLAAVKGWMDRYQPHRAIDETAARFAQLDLDRGPRKIAGAPDVDDTAERFKMIELNPGKRRNPGAPRTYRLQKVVSRLERTPTPQTIKAGMIASSPQQIVGDTLADYLDSNATESFLILHIDIKNRIIGYTEFNSGGTAGVEVHMPGVFRDALGAGAAAVLSVHNHPSGDPTPSDQDRALWSRLRASGEVVGIPVLDNLVVGENGRFYSESANEIDQATNVRRHAAEKRSRS